MRSIKLLLCGVLLCALIFPASLAENETPAEAPAATNVAATEKPSEPTSAPSEPTATPAPDSTPTADTNATPDAGNIPTQPPSQEPTLDPSDEPTSSVSPSPTASASPSAEPPASIEPTPSAEPTVSVEPTVSAEPSPSIEPTATPLPRPEEIGNLVSIVPEGNSTQENGVWHIALDNPQATLAFGWTVQGDAISYLVYTADAQNVLSFQGEITSNRVELSSAAYAQGQYSIYVGAVFADESISWGSAQFKLMNGQMQPNGFPGGFHGGFSGGGRPGNLGFSELPESEKGFHVTPGEALTSAHAAGSKDMTAYTDAGLNPTDEIRSELILGDTQSKILLDNGNTSFRMELSDAKLLLCPESQGSCWNLSVLALNTLKSSGIDSICLQLNGTSITISTDMQFSGAVYGSLRTQGYVDKDFAISVSENGLWLSIAGNQYSINDSGELIPLEG